MIGNASLERLFKALVRRHFNYYSLLWDNCLADLRIQLQRLQNKAARVITGESYYSSATETLIYLNWVGKCFSVEGMNNSSP